MQASVAGIPKIHWIGPAKIWGLAHPTNNNTREKFDRLISSELKSSALIPIACMGEIDIRVNLAKRLLKNRNFDEIKGLVRIYLERLNEIDAPEIVIWGPPPSVPDSKNISAEFPVYGDCRTRNCLTHLFNREILLAINQFKKMKFLTVFYDLVDDDLNTRTDALHDGMHLAAAHLPLAQVMLAQSQQAGVKAVLNFAKYQQVGEVGFQVQADAEESATYLKARRVRSKEGSVYFSRLPAPLEFQGLGHVAVRRGPTEPVLASPALECSDEEFLSQVFLGASAADFAGFASFLNDKNTQGFRNHFDSLESLDAPQARAYLAKFDSLLNGFLSRGETSPSPELMGCARALCGLLGAAACAPLIEKLQHLAWLPVQGLSAEPAKA